MHFSQKFFKPWIYQTYCSYISQTLTSKIKFYSAHHLNFQHTFPVCNVISGLKIRKIKYKNNMKTIYIIGLTTLLVPVFWPTHENGLVILKQNKIVL